MMHNFFEDVEYQKDSQIQFDSDSEDDSKIDTVFINCKDKELIYDSEDEKHYYVINHENLKKRYDYRIRYFNKYKKKFNLNSKVEDMYMKLLDYLYYEKPISFLYFIKKICDYYNTPINIKIKRKVKYENIWDTFLSHLISKRNSIIII